MPAQALSGMGFELVSTGGSASAIEAAGLPVKRVEDLTGFPEMLDGACDEWIRAPFPGQGLEHTLFCYLAWRRGGPHSHNDLRCLACLPLSPTSFIITFYSEPQTLDTYPLRHSQ